MEMSLKIIYNIYNIILYTYILCLLHELECDMVKYFISRLIYFQESKAVKIKPVSEISSHMTPTSVISGLFHTRYLH